MDPLAIPAGENAASLVAAVEAKLALRAEPGIDMPSVFVEAARIFETLDALKRDPAIALTQLSYVTATDETPETPRFRLVYFLYSFRANARLRVHTRVPESDAPVVRSVVPLFLSANWMEREVFDMFGVRFEGHPDLRRVLMPEGYGHHPLRKDFPLEGIEPDRLYREWDRSRAASHAAAENGKERR